jgi:lysophospholipase L1-like esterase
VITLLFFCGLCLATLAVPGRAAIPPSDSALRWYGRWDRSQKEEYVSQWAGAYLKAAFTGHSVSVLLNDSEPSSFYMRVDDGPVAEFTEKTGTVDLTPPGGLKPGTHQLFLIARVGKTLRFRGLALSGGGRAAAPKIGKNTVLFVGDSITFGASATNPTLDSWAPRAATTVGCDHTRIAQGGIGLVDGYDAPIGKCGMEKQFFQLGAFGSPKGDTPYAGFAVDRPSLIVVNLGTNDGNKNEKNPVTMGVFRERYAAFLKALRTIYPNTPILALELFNRNKDKCEAIRQAVAQTVRETEDERFRVISTDGWVNPNPVGGDIAPDWSHPTDQGHAKLAQRMADVLRENLSPKETNR